MPEEVIENLLHDKDGDYLDCTFGMGGHSKAILKKLSVIDEDDINKHIKFVNDRPGHDKRYAINSEKIKIECKWHPKTSFEEGLELTINSILIDRREQ